MFDVQVLDDERLTCRNENFAVRASNQRHTQLRLAENDLYILRLIISGNSISDLVEESHRF